MGYVLGACNPSLAHQALAIEPCGTGKADTGDTMNVPMQLRWLVALTISLVRAGRLSMRL
jgi:hypothetical protein